MRLELLTDQESLRRVLGTREGEKKKEDVYQMVRSVLHAAGQMSCEGNKRRLSASVKHQNRPEETVGLLAACEGYLDRLRTHIPPDGWPGHRSPTTSC